MPRFYLSHTQDDSDKFLNSKSAWLLSECVNACASVAKVICCDWQVLDDAPPGRTTTNSPAGCCPFCFLRGLALQLWTQPNVVC